jgi:riboflavin kinase/FMN adenylyltransferase
VRIIHDLTQLTPDKPVVLTLGVFDGVHLGHQTLIRRVVASARERHGLSVVLTLDPHPVEVLSPGATISYLTTLDERLELIGRQRVDLCLVFNFTPQVAQTSARDFILFLGDHLRLVELWEGPDFVFGHGRQGDHSFLQALGDELGFTVQRVDYERTDGTTISSTRIRELILAGEVTEAATMLGRPPSVRGPVVPGVERGHRLGFPTANIELPPKKVLPANGVYAARLWLGAGESAPVPLLNGVANVGVRPSFGETRRTVEAHIFDFDRTIYGQTLEIQFVARLREERRFGNVEELVAQIQRDVEQARAILAPRRYEEVDHTADIGIRVRGRDLAELFANAAYGMFSLMLDMDHLPQTLSREVQVEAFDVETLLVDWLSELNYRRELAGEVYHRFDIQEISPTRLKAIVAGTDSVRPRRLVKAVTFHDLAVKQTPEGYQAVIVFDV